MKAPEPGLRATPTFRPKNGEQPSDVTRRADAGLLRASLLVPRTTLVQFAQQIGAYLALGFWAARNRDIVSRLGLENGKIRDGLR